ncbi:MAG: hypothetical protein WAM09_01030 [Anaerolineales bacterium]
MKTHSPLQPGIYYHIFNRGNNGEDLFREDRNYSYFLNLYVKHILPVADTYAYCLLVNHFHFLVRIKNEEEIVSIQMLKDKNEKILTRENRFNPSLNFSNMFNAYSKAINISYSRTGSLFEERFNRIQVTQDTYFLELIFYIHYNPQKHGLIDNFRNWQWSSYHALIGNFETRLMRDEVLELFGSKNAFEEFHRGMAAERKLSGVIDDE